MRAARASFRATSAARRASRPSGGAPVVPEQRVEAQPLAALLGVDRLDLARDHGDDVRGDARVELGHAVEARHDVALQEALHRAQQLLGRRAVVHGDSSIRRTSSSSASAVRRPRLASSREGTLPVRYTHDCWMKTSATL